MVNYVFDQLLLNQMQIFNKLFNFYLKPEFSWKVFKFVLKPFFSDQAFWDFLDACSTFSTVCIKKIGYLTKVFSCKEKEYDKKSQFMTYFRL